MKDSLLAIWKDTEERGAYAPTPENTGRRSLRYAALGLLAAGAPKIAVDLIQRDLAKASNMTAEIGAFSALVGIDAPETNLELEKFHARHAGDQSAGGQVVFPQLAGGHSRCGRTNRSAHGPSGFPPEHAQPGLCADRRVHVDESFRLPCGRWRGLPGGGRYDPEMDAINPQVAARMATGFRSWRIMDEVRRKAAAGQLERILASPGLSRDCFEIVSKTLKG